MSDQIPPTVGSSAPRFSPGVVRPEPCCTWSPGALVYYATDGISQYRLDHDGVSRSLSGRERAVALALLDYVREQLTKTEAAA